MDKRTFLKSTTALGVATFTPFPSIAAWVNQFEEKAAFELANDEVFWKGIRADYNLKPDYINLEGGFYCILPKSTLEKQIEHIREINYQGSYYMRTTQLDDKALMMEKLSKIAGCTSEEIIITRNTTESLDMIISGWPWQAGDEAVMAEQDYGAMLNMFQQVAKRYGVVNKIVSLLNHPKSDEEIVELYANAITPKTKILMVCHMVNITGQILPIRKICDMAHSRGVKVMVDGAHAFAHMQFSIPDLHCDYYGTSLHKWLSVPLGAGMLYVKKENIAGVWPLFGDEGRKEDDVLRLNHIGTHPVATHLTIADAIDYYQLIGPARKEARLRYLQNYWTAKARKLSHVEINTPEDPARSCAIANVGVRGMKPGDLAKALLEKYKIWTVAIDGAGVHGCRITPNVFTSTDELNTFVAALNNLKT